MTSRVKGPYGVRDIPGQGMLIPGDHSARAESSGRTPDQGCKHETRVSLRGLDWIWCVNCGAIRKAKRGKRWLPPDKALRNERRAGLWVNGS